MFARFVARRYLFAPKSRSVINRIASLSVVAVAMPVAAMIVLLSVFNGFETLVKSTCSAFDAALTVRPLRGQTFDTNLLDTAALRRIGDVEALSYVLEQTALVERDGRQAAVTVRGVDDEYTQVLPQIPDAVVSGEYRVRLGDLDRLVVGQTMAYTLGVRSLAESDVAVYALRRGSISTLLPVDSYTKRTVPTAGVYALDQDTERQYVLTSLRLAQELFTYPGRASALLVGLAPGVDPAAAKQVVQQAVGPDFDVRTQYELRASFYALMSYEKWGIFFITMLVLLVASFSVVGSLGMLITDKRDDIATLRALGASTSVVRSVFRWEGWLVAGLGGAAGAVLGVTLSLLQQHFGLIGIPAETFLTQSYPVEFRLWDLAAVAAAFAVVTAVVVGLTTHTMIKTHDDEKN